MKIHEAAVIAGISVRTLHHYDEFGLLCPKRSAENGYREYSQEDMLRLQEILFFRELGFELADILRIVSDEKYDRTEALKRHRELLIKSRERTDRLIKLVENSIKGESTMSFKEFDNAELEALKQEAKERYGNTEAYREFEKRPKANQAETMKESDELMAQFGKLLGSDATGAQVQELVEQWRAHITRNYYNCTVEILGQLGEMYVCDERFTANIDRFGTGTAQLMHDAIAVYCKNNK